MGRNTQGVRIMNLNEGDQIASIAKVAREDAPETPAGETPPPVEAPPAVEPPQAEGGEAGNE
jgi:hypothetical protein